MKKFILISTALILTACAADPHGTQRAYYWKGERVHRNVAEDIRLHNIYMSQQPTANIDFPINRAG